MEDETIYYVTKLIDEFSVRQRSNSSYSLRAFAKYLELDSSNLSSVFKNKRKLPSKRAQGIANKLNLSPLEEGMFVRSALNHKLGLPQPVLSQTDAKILNEEIHYNVITQWEYLAVLNLVNVCGIEITPKVISTKLGVPNKRASAVLENLIKSNLLKYEGDKLVRTAECIQTTEDKFSVAIQKGHVDRLDLAKEKLEKVSVKKRDFSSIVVSGNSSKLPLVKAMIREFQDNLAQVLDEDEQDEVFQISMQIFPLTEKSLSTNSEERNEKTD